MLLKRGTIGNWPNSSANFKFPARRSFLEYSEIPGTHLQHTYSLGHKSSLNGLEVGVEGVFSGAVDVDLVEHVEGDVVLLDELLDLGIAARLLMGFKSTS